MAKPDWQPPHLFREPLRVVNVGLELFYRSLLSQGARTVHVTWRPPAGGDPKLTQLLDRLTERRRRE